MNVCSRTLLVASAACLSLAATGCVTGPLDGDTIYKHNQDTVDFYGFAYSPGEFVEIQARDQNGVWQSVDYAISANWVINWNGIKLYYWEVDDVLIKSEPGMYLWHPTGNSQLKFYSEVRVVDSSGYGMATFNQNYPGMNAALSMTFGDLWSLAGNGSSLTLYAQH